MKDQENRYFEKLDSQGERSVNFSDLGNSCTTSFACSIPLEQKKLNRENGFIAKCLLIFNFICAPRKTLALIHLRREQILRQKLNSTEAVEPELELQDVEFIVEGRKFSSSWGRNVLNSR